MTRRASGDPLYFGDILGRDPSRTVATDAIRSPFRGHPADPVIDPFGNVPRGEHAAARAARRRVRVVLRECLIAYILLLAFMFGGHAFLTLMRLSKRRCR